MPKRLTYCFYVILYSAHDALCMYVRMCVCVYVCVYIYMCVCVCLCMSACIYVCMCVYKHVRIYIIGKQVGQRTSQHPLVWLLSL